MPLDYELEHRMKALSPVMEDVVAWYGHMMMQCYGGRPQSALSIQSFSHWLRTAYEDAFFDAASLDGLKTAYNDLMVRAQSFAEGTAPQERDEQQRGLVDLSEAYLAFYSRLHQIQKECFSGDAGFDALTGLRTKDVLAKDFDRELERVEREGEGFALLWARVDFYDDIQTAQGQDFAADVTKQVADFMKQAIRGFDDAYCLDSGEFVLIIRQSDISGSLAVSTRLQELIKTANVTVIAGDDQKQLSVSAAIAAPLPGDVLDTMLGQMRGYMDKYKDKPGFIHEYREISPAQAYVRNNETGS